MTGVPTPFRENPTGETEMQRRGGGKLHAGVRDLPSGLTGEENVARVPPVGEKVLGGPGGPNAAALKKGGVAGPSSNDETVRLDLAPSPLRQFPLCVDHREGSDFCF